jgi:hypothetical protein
LTLHAVCPPRRCDVEEPELREVEPEHLMRCHFSIEALRQAEAPVGAPTDA